MAFVEVSTRRILIPLAFVASLLLQCACDEKAASPSTQTARRVVTTGPAGTGVIRGTVSFRGTAPGGEEVDGARCHAGAGKIRVSPVEVAPGGGLKDVMVYVKDPSTVPAVDERLAAPVLDQVYCQYTPRVLGVRVGQDRKSVV